MHVSTKPVPATFTLIFVLAVFVTMLHRIVYILNVVNPFFLMAPEIWKHEKKAENVLNQRFRLFYKQNLFQIGFYFC